MGSNYQYSVVSKIMRDFAEENILSWLDKVELEGFDQYILYQSALTTGKIKVIAKLIKNKNVASDFSFVSDLTESWIQSGDIEKLEYPQIQTKNLSFIDVIKLISADKFNRYILGKFAELVRSYGIKSINDVNLLLRIYGRNKFDFAEFFRLDNSIKIPRIDIGQAIYLDPILQKYSLKRTIHLLRTATTQDMELIAHNQSLLGAHMRMEILTGLPRKPKTLSEISNYLVKKLAAAYPPEKPLNQNIACFNNQMFSTYQIWIPATVEDLRSAAVTLENCLDRYVSRVLENEIQVMILLEEGTPKYALEIDRQAGKYVVTSMKGKKNSNVANIAKIREELYEIFDRPNLSNVSST